MRGLVGCAEHPSGLNMPLACCAQMAGSGEELELTPAGPVSSMEDVDELMSQLQALSAR